MKAIINTKYGSPDVLSLQEVDKSTPKKDEVLVKIKAASVNAYDWHALRAKPFIMRLVFGLFKPKHQTLGVDIAGIVEAVGEEIKHFSVGDEVYGDLSACGAGGFAEYKCTKEKYLALKPSNFSFEEAAAMPMAAITALQALRDHGQIKSGQRVAINGASGGVGSYAVQLAKYFGSEVTAICSSKKMQMLKSLGADYVIDYTKEDFTKQGKQYDLILAANGYHPLKDYKRALKEKGTYIMSGGNNAQIFGAMFLAPFISGKRTMKNMVAVTSQKDLNLLASICEEGKIKIIIDKTYALKDVADAIRYMEKGSAKGKVVIKI